LYLSGIGNWFSECVFSYKAFVGVAVVNVVVAAVAAAAAAAVVVVVNDVVFPSVDIWVVVFVVVLTILQIYFTMQC